MEGHTQKAHEGSTPQSETRKRTTKTKPNKDQGPSHVKRFFLKKHDLCTHSTPAICAHADEIDEAINLYKTNPALIFSHNNPWSPEREKRFQERIKDQLNKINNHPPPPPVISLHRNPFPGQFSNVPDVAAQADSDTRTDGCIRMERISPTAYRRAGNNFFVN